MTLWGGFLLSLPCGLSCELLEAVSYADRILRVAGTRNAGASTTMHRANTQEMVRAVKSMFPDIPEASIRYDLLHSGSAEVTCDRILQQGYLPVPPPGFSSPDDEVTDLTTTTDSPNHRPVAAAAAAAAQGESMSRDSASSSISPSLIKRYHLENRLNESGTPAAEVKGKSAASSAWSSNVEEREQSLQERKAQMILQARKRMEERREAAAKTTASTQM